MPSWKLAVKLRGSVFLRFSKGVVGELQGVNTIFLSTSDTFNSFSQKRKFPFKYA